MNSFSTIDCWVKPGKTLEERAAENERAMDELLNEKRLLGHMQELKEETLSHEFSEVKAISVQGAHRKMNECGDMLQEEILSLTAHTDMRPFTVVLDRGQNKLLSDTQGIVEWFLHAPKMTKESLEKLTSAIENSFSPVFDDDIEFRMKIAFPKPSGAEINARVAQEVMGLRLFKASCDSGAKLGESVARDGVWIDTGEMSESPNWAPGDKEIISVVEPIPNYCEDVAEAFKAAQTLKGTGAEKRFNQNLAAHQNGSFSLCGVTAMDICLAAMEAKGAEGRQEELEVLFADFTMEI